MGLVAPIRRTMMAYELPGPRVLARLQQRVSLAVQASNPATLSLPVTAWSVALVLGPALSSPIYEGCRVHLHLPGVWWDNDRTWADEALRKDFSSFRTYLCSDPLASLALAIDMGPELGFQVSEHAGYEEAVSAATQEVEFLLAVGEKNPPAVAIDVPPMDVADFAWRKAAAADREWVDLVDLVGKR